MLTHRPSHGRTWAATSLILTVGYFLRLQGSLFRRELLLWLNRTGNDDLFWSTATMTGGGNICGHDGGGKCGHDDGYGFGQGGGGVGGRGTMVSMDDTRTMAIGIEWGGRSVAAWRARGGLVLAPCRRVDSKSIQHLACVCSKMDISICGSSLDLRKY
jgi:hypothetical protein